MKAIAFVAGMTVFGGVAGAAYAEYSRITTEANNARYHVLQVTEVYRDNPDKALEAVSEGTRHCAKELYSVEFPPVMTALMTDTLSADYEVAKKYGAAAGNHPDKLRDLRNMVSNRYYDAVGEELDKLPPEVERRVLKLMSDFRVERKDIARCINAKAFVVLIEHGALKTNG